MERLKDKSIINRISLIIVAVIVFLAVLLNLDKKLLYDLTGKDIKWEVTYSSSSKVEPDSKDLANSWVKNAPGINNIVVESDESSQSGWRLNISTPTDATDGAAYYYQMSENDKWYKVDNEKGWTVAFRLKVLSTGDRPQIVKINDGEYEEIFLFLKRGCAFEKNRSYIGYWSLFNVYHTFWVVGRGTDFSVYMDNDLLVTRKFAATAIEGKNLMFGDDAFSQDGWGGQVYWDYIKYTTEGPFLPEVYCGFDFSGLLRDSLIGLSLYFLFLVLYKHEEYQRSLYQNMLKTIAVLPEGCISVFILTLIVNTIIWSPEGKSIGDGLANYAFLFLVVGVIAWLVRSCIVERG